jgi:hypothetical protein
MERIERGARFGRGGKGRVRPAIRPQIAGTLWPFAVRFGVSTAESLNVMPNIVGQLATYTRAKSETLRPDLRTGEKITARRGVVCAECDAPFTFRPRPRKSFCGIEARKSKDEEKMQKRKYDEEEE